MNKKNFYVLFSGLLIVTLVLMRSHIMLIAALLCLLMLLVTILLSVYAFVRGSLLSGISSKLRKYYHFRLDVLNNKVQVSKETSFVAPLLLEVKQSIADVEEKESKLRSIGASPQSLPS